MLKKLKQQYRVTYDSESDDSFIVHRDKGMNDMKFIMHPTGLHYYDPAIDDEELIFINTVEGNKKGFSKRQMKGAELAKRLYISLVYPSGMDLKWAVMSNQIKNCPVTTEDVKNAHDIWGKNIHGLKGKTMYVFPHI